jgi:hypothetical protein
MSRPWGVQPIAAAISGEIAVAPAPVSTSIVSGR